MQSKGAVMKKRLILALLLSSAFVFFGCSGKESGSSGKNGKVTIIYTGNIGGRIDPCGCRIPKGGLARRATIVKDMRTQTPDAIVLDSGALLYESIRLNAPFEPAHRAKAHLAVEEVVRTGIDAVNVSAMDLADSADSLQAFGAQGMPWLSANIAWRKTGELVFKPDIIKTVGNLRVGVFGFMDDNSLGVTFFDETSPLKVLDPLETARTEVEKLRKECDMVIALAYMDFDRVQKLVDTVPGIDVAIVSHTRDHNPGSEHVHFMPVKEGKTVLARCPDGGRVIGRLELEIVNGSTDFADAESFKDLRPAEVRAKDKNVKVVSSFRNFFTDLDPSVASELAVQEKVEKALAVWDAISRSIKKKS
jgi:2',3'-cyclic-nucleotide 2'-phosphodiesterase (5'-nucleotidase family)